MPNDPKDRPVDRRRFFREGLRELLRPFAGALDPLERTLSQFQPPLEAPAPPPTKAVSPPAWHRPPGALAESKFLDTCSRCGDCVRVCPVHAIRLDATTATGNGAPYIDANTAACVLCDGLHCMNTCPTGALVPTPLVDIDMGTAVWHETTCLRSRGEDCTLCIDQCPLGTAAINVAGNEVAVNPLVCNGCGVCQQSCPTQPKSITVIPIAMKRI